MCWQIILLYQNDVSIHINDELNSFVFNLNEAALPSRHPPSVTLPWHMRDTCVTIPPEISFCSPGFFFNPYYTGWFLVVWCQVSFFRFWIECWREDFKMSCIVWRIEVKRKVLKKNSCKERWFIQLNIVKNISLIDGDKL